MIRVDRGMDKYVAHRVSGCVFSDLEVWSYRNLGRGGVLRCPPPSWVC